MIEQKFPTLNSMPVCDVFVFCLVQYDTVGSSVMYVGDNNSSMFSSGVEPCWMGVTYSLFFSFSLLSFCLFNRDGTKVRASHQTEEAIQWSSACCDVMVSCPHIIDMHKYSTRAIEFHHYGSRVISIRISIHFLLSLCDSIVVNSCDRQHHRIMAHPSSSASSSSSIIHYPSSHQDQVHT